MYSNLILLGYLKFLILSNIFLKFQNKKYGRDYNFYGSYLYFDSFSRKINILKSLLEALWNQILKNF